MAFRTRYRRKAPSVPEVQGLFFKKAQVAPAFFNPSRQTGDRSRDTATHSIATPVIQRQEATIAPAKPEEEKSVQKQDKQEEEKTVQKQVKEEEPVQKQDKQEEEKTVQKQVKEEEPVQKQGNQNDRGSVKAKVNTYRSSDSSEEPQDPTGLPDRLKTGVEALSGISMNDVKVHYNSPKPARMQALAYTQGTDIYLAPGQERHLSHEVWHVVQQKQGRVAPTLQAKGVNVNEDAGLEQEATVMGQKANQQSSFNSPD